MEVFDGDRFHAGSPGDSSDFRRPGISSSLQLIDIELQPKFVEEEQKMDCSISGLAAVFSVVFMRWNRCLHAVRGPNSKSTSSAFAEQKIDGISSA
jgi:hypothetical protein